MLNVVRQHVPDTWTDTYSDKTDVYDFSEEYKQLQYEVRRAVTNTDLPKITKMIRSQDLHAYGQFLIREQLLINSNDAQLYRVRFFIQIHSMYLDQVLKYNLDPRRCGMGQSLTFKKKLNYFDCSSLVVVVKALTTEPHADSFTPSTSCDYYVEYVLKF